MLFFWSVHIDTLVPDLVSHEHLQVVFGQKVPPLLFMLSYNALLIALGWSWTPWIHSYDLCWAMVGGASMR